jgi:hypothetical protein
MQHLNELLLEILITPLVGAMVERGIQKPVCEECGEPASYQVDDEDRCPTDRGMEVRRGKVYLCRDHFEEFEERMA